MTETGGEPSAVLSVRGLTRRYGDALAVGGVDFDVREGEVFTLLGHSGCGKSTTLRMIAGLEEPDGGRILLRGRPVFDPAAGIYVPAERRNVGMVFQSYAIWPHMTVFENVAYPLKVRRLDRARITERVRAICEVVGMGAFLDRPSMALSGGQQQRVALARAMAYEPDLLLLDEPFSNLDAKLREEMRLQLRQMQARFGTTIVYVTHDQTEALALSHRIAVMREGAFEQVGEPVEVYERPRTHFVQDFVGRTVVLPGEVMDGRAIRLDGDDAAILAGAAAGLAGRVRVVIRPEDIFLSGSAEAGPDTVWIAGKVFDRSYGGDHNDYMIEVAGGQVGLRLAKDTAFAPGAAIRLGFNAARARIWQA